MSLESWWEKTMTKRVREHRCISCGGSEDRVGPLAKQVTANGGMLCKLCVKCGWDSPDQLEVYARRTRKLNA